MGANPPGVQKSRPVQRNQAGSGMSANGGLADSFGLNATHEPYIIVYMHVIRVSMKMSYDYCAS